MQHEHHRTRPQTQIVQPPGVRQAVLLAVDEELDQARVDVAQLRRVHKKQRNGQSCDSGPSQLFPLSPVQLPA
jgi:hypothetical protein